ncbi:hypothetical protein EBB79_22030 (plasmid) [Parasedimentitalea marina]|uniref:Uncharacterized protein n=1 Tax=Parasedimentitalea marina TaxID=2483033 RepID=A0A3T0N9H9_9RHOB|nr:hypothetical protein [Parasedimentitalea marina]AZV80641.1 hypothetical protein EBB79_22030 [Parasedimentitalea marina]
MLHVFQRSLISGIGALGFIAGAAQADQVILDDLIVDGSICAGFDCVNGESFGFDTLRLKENNLRIHAVDTSNSASFPSNDWQITFNDSSNGGANKFSIDDIDGGRTPFTIEAGAPSHSLYVDNAGRLGIGTNNPVVEIHVPDGDTPTLRLEQNGSSGFTPQTWDVAGNETNFFVRDATNGSKLPFKIRPSAPTNSIYVDTDGDLGLGTASPRAALDVANGSIIASASGAVGLTLDDTSGSDPDFKLQYESGSARMSFAGTGQPELELKQNGNIVVAGTCVEFARGGSSFACTFAAGGSASCAAAPSSCP